MSDFQGIIEKFKEAYANYSFFYVANDPERALGLEQIIPNYRIACIDNSQLLNHLDNQGIPYLALEQEQGVNKIHRSSIKLIKSIEFNKFFHNYRKDNNAFQTFKVSPFFEKRAQEFSAQLLNTSADLNRRFENKLPQLEFFQEIDAKIPLSENTVLSETNYHTLKQKFSEKFVIQFNRGHTGSGTVFISNEDDLAKVTEQFPDRVVRISRFVEGPAYTLNACITKHGVAMGGLSYQITGVPELTGQAGGTVGNDWAYRKHISAKVMEQILTATTKIGKAMSTEGFKGMFGIDLIVQGDEIFVIEVNARQPASIPMYTKMQLLDQQLPLSLLHLFEFLDFDYQLNIEKYNERSMQPHQFSQIFARADAEYTVATQVQTGVYRLQSDNTAINRLNDEILENTLFIDEERDKPLVFQRVGYTIDDLAAGGMLVLAPMKGKQFKSGQEVARIQINQQVMTSEDELSHWVKEALSAIKHYQL